MITTRWVPCGKQYERRFVGPKWVAYLVVRMYGKSITPVVGRIFGALSKLVGARLQYRRRRG
jgi:hypothetical protein